MKITACVVTFVAAVVLAACQGGGSAPATATSVTGTAVPTGGCPRPTLPPVASGAVVVPGPTGGLPPSDAGGDRLVLEAVVLDRACQPVPRARVELWHTDARGVYRPEGSDGLYYHGMARTDANGRFRIETIRPAQYPEPGAPPAHIHLDIRHSAGRLMTEIVFSDEPVPPLATSGAATVPVTLSRVDDHWYGEAALVSESTR